MIKRKPFFSWIAILLSCSIAINAITEILHEIISNEEPIPKDNLSITLISGYAFVLWSSFVFSVIISIPIVIAWLRKEKIWKLALWACIATVAMNTIFPFFLLFN